MADDDDDDDDKLLPASHHRHRHRREASGPGWQEHFVDAARASASDSVGAAVAASMSYVTISHFASEEERRALMDSAARVQSSRGGGDGDGDGEAGSHHILFASGANANCDRYSVETLLDGEARAASAALLRRLLRFLDYGRCSCRRGEGGHPPGDDPGDDPPDFVPDGGGERMSVLAEAVFGSTCSSSAAAAAAAAAASSGTSSETELLEAGLGLGLGDREVAWYDEPDEAGNLHPEPKVNVYTEGGSFAQHGDGMDLTLLVVLTDPGDFEGGGTAFYRDLDLSHEDLQHVLEPTKDDHFHSGMSMSNASHSLDPESVARPEAGTAMIWGGALQHRALPVTGGTRAVYVGSFNLN